MDKIIDFSNCEIQRYNYSGKSQKMLVKYDNDVYMLKFEEHPRQKANLSYTNSWASEYIACHFIETLDIPVQQTLLGMYNDYKVVACKDFTGGTLFLQEFSNSSTPSSNTTRDSLILDDVLETIEKQNIVDPAIVKERFWEQFVIDAYIGNYDRHNSNWGFLVDRNSNQASLAPIYDCGGSLYPFYSDNDLSNLLNSPSDLEPKIKNEPSSVYKHNGQKINYTSYLLNSNNPDLQRAIKKIVPNFNIQKINKIIDNTPMISNVRKEFYKKTFQLKHELILLKAYKKIQKTEKRLSKGSSR